MKIYLNMPEFFGVSDVNTTQLSTEIFLILFLHTPQKSGAINEKLFF